MSLDVLSLSHLKQSICFNVLCICLFVYIFFQTFRVAQFVYNNVNHSTADTAYGLSNTTSFTGKLNGSSANTAFSMFNNAPSTGKRCFHLFWNASSILRPLNTLDSRENKHVDSKSCRRFLNIDKYIGRMGNQLFQFASLLGMAYEYDVIPIIQRNSSLTNYFDLPNQSDLELENTVKCFQSKAGIYYNCTKEFTTLGRHNNGSMYGYLQSWKYFEKSRTIIKQALKMKNKHLENARHFIAEIAIPGYQIVCIHVRRGDMTSTELRDYGYTVADRDFFERARQFYTQEFSKVKFIVVTNDKKWCRDNINDVDLSPFTNAADDMALLTSCDHVVVTSGSFGWWGAWLSGGKTVYFKGFPRSGSKLDMQMNREDYYPPSWVAIP